MHNERKERSNPALVPVILFVAAALLLFCLNFLTGPIIEKNGSAQAFAPLFSVMPDAKDFEVLYDVNDSAASELKDVPETVQSVCRETSGLGYALCLSTTQGYTGEPIEFALAIDAEGKISGVEVTSYPETKDFGQDTYPQSFLGQDSTLANVSLVAGVTYSSTAFKNAVSDGFAVLVNNGLIGAGVKSDEQVLTELAAQVFTALANSAGVAQYEEVDLSAGQYTYIQKGLKALNGSGFAFILKDGDSTLLAVCNLKGSCKLLDAEGQDVTENADYAAMLAEVTAYAEANAEQFAQKDIAKLQSMTSDSAQITELPLDGVFSTVTGAFRIQDGGAQYYGFAARSYGYSNEVMTVYYILDANGAIVRMQADELIFYAEYFSDYTLDESQYKAGFAGLTGDTFTGEQALISGATASSNAVAAATKDTFAAYQIIQANGGENG